MAEQAKAPRRPLTEGEALVLSHIQDMYGPQNSVDKVFFSDRNEAVLFVTDNNGVAGLAAVLTNLAAWLQDGTIATVEELRNKWLTPQRRLTTRSSGPSRGSAGLRGRAEILRPLRAAGGGARPLNASVRRHSVVETHSRIAPWRDRRNWIHAAKLLVTLCPVMVIYSILGGKVLVKVCGAVGPSWCDVVFAGYVAGGVLITRYFYIWLKPKDT